MHFFAFALNVDVTDPFPAYADKVTDSAQRRSGEDGNLVGRVLPCGVGALMVFGLATAGQAQTSSDALAAALPDAPGRLSTAQETTRSAQAGMDRLSMGQGTASVGGVVVDSTGAAVPGARVTLTRTGTAAGSVTSAGHGEFSFTGLPASVFRVTIQAAGFQPLVSAEIRLTAGEGLQLPQFELAVSSAGSSVEVYASEREVAQVQVKEAEQQRVLGVLPNFYSSYIWDAAPLAAKQKFDLATHSVLDPFEFVGAGVVAGAQQAANSLPGYGQGAAGFGKRYGAALADGVTARMIGSALLPSLFHQDPRYFYRGSGSGRSRMFYAISNAVICRGDNGHRQFNISYVLGAFASGGLSYAYHAAGDRSGTQVLRSGLINIGAHAGDDLMREFFLRRITPKVPAFETGKPPELPAKP